MQYGYLKNMLTCRWSICMSAIMNDG